MQTITIEVLNDRDKQLILMLARRLGLRWGITAKEKNTTVNNDKYLKIIEAGIDASEVRLKQLLKGIESDRQDRELPFGDA